MHFGDTDPHQENILLLKHGISQRVEKKTKGLSIARTFSNGIGNFAKMHKVFLLSLSLPGASSTNMREIFALFVATHTYM